MKDSKEFALELFDALSRRRRLKVEKITKDELYEYWSQITDQSFDSRLQIFFDMYLHLLFSPFQLTSYFLIYYYFFNLNSLLGAVSG